MLILNLASCRIDRCNPPASHAVEYQSMGHMEATVSISTCSTKCATPEGSSMLRCVYMLQIGACAAMSREPCISGSTLRRWRVHSKRLGFVHALQCTVHTRNKKCRAFEQWSTLLSCRQSYCGSLLLSMGGLSLLEWTRQNLHLTGYLSRHFALDLAACVGMYIPIMAHGPLWLYWAFQLTRFPRYGRCLHVLQMLYHTN